jgi:nucleotide-binding universal stress UspA family protein
MMPTNQDVLVAIDDRPATERAVKAAARHVAGHPERHIVLFHVLPTLPTELLEFGGRADEAEERHGLQELRQQRHAWMAEARVQAQPLYDRLTAILQDAGVTEDQIEEGYDAPNPECTVAREILRVARERSIGTIFIGHHGSTGRHALFRQHVGQELARRARDEDVLIIGGAQSA